MVGYDDDVDKATRAERAMRRAALLNGGGLSWHRLPIGMPRCQVSSPHPLSWAHGIVVSHPLSMREALASIPSVSTSFNAHARSSGSGRPWRFSAGGLCAHRRVSPRQALVRPNRERVSRDSLRAGRAHVTLRPCARHVLKVTRNSFSPAVLTRVGSNCMSARSSNMRLAHLCGVGFHWWRCAPNFQCILREATRCVRGLSRKAFQENKHAKNAQARRSHAFARPSMFEVQVGGFGSGLLH